MMINKSVFESVVATLQSLHCGITQCILKFVVGFLFLTKEQVYASFGAESPEFIPFLQHLTNQVPNMLGLSVCVKLC